MKTIKMLISAAVAAAVIAAAGPASAADLKKADCLQCHGPLEKLTQLAPMYQTESGKVINPHKFIPHDSKDPAKFPECTTCHTPHPMPPPKGFKDKSANVEMCYSCHHNYTFQKCSACHK